ncbi:MAG: hypothetical protein AAFU67_16335 [Bacteroidota bacterium]
MKVRISLLVSCLFFAFSIAAQGSAIPAIYEDATTIADRYQLDDEQVIKLADIITTRNNNLAAVESLRDADGPTFWRKRKAIYTGQQASIKRLLTSKEQLLLFAEQHTENRKIESKLLKEMLAAGHARELARLLVWQQLY